MSGYRTIKRPLRRVNKRLKLMGLKPKVVILKEEGYIIIPLEQLVELIKQRVQYQGVNINVYIEENKLVVRVWKEKRM